MDAFYKLAYDISCYYAFVAFFLSYGIGYNLSPYSFAVFFIACFLAAYAEKMLRFDLVVRVIAFVLPVIPFLLETGNWGKISVILPWIYLVVTVLRQGYDIEYRRFRNIYLIFFWGYIAVFAFYMAQDWTKGETAMLAAGPFILILLVSGIFLLQMLRFQSGSTDKQTLEKYQRGQLIGFIIASIVLTVGNVIELLYTYVFSPIINLLFGAGTAGVVFVVSKLDSPMKPPKKFENGKSEEEFTVELREAWERIEGAYKPFKEFLKRFEPDEPIEMDYTPLLIGTAVLVAIVILVVMIGFRRKKRKPAAIEDERDEFFEEVTPEQVLKKRSVRPEIVIRYYYREFMKKSEAKKHKLKASDTTKEIFTKYNVWKEPTPEQSEKAQEATLLYQKTRYSKAKITKSDAGRMKALVKGL